MSLISKKAIQIAGPDIRIETITTFRKEKDKTYTKITKEISRNWKTGQIKLMKRQKVIEEGPYITIDKSEYDNLSDEKIRYLDINEKEQFVYLKKGDEYESSTV
tara:strand:+ start:186 stop:497 length:312 start_codon:yes stop_codon:yes gene_type:complete